MMPPLIGPTIGPTIIINILKKYANSIEEKRTKISDKDVVIADIQSFPYEERSPIGILPYDDTLDPNEVSDILEEYNKAITESYSAIIEELENLKSSVLSEKSLTLSDGSAPVVDVLEALIDYINQASSSVTGKCNNVVTAAMDRQMLEESEIRKIIESRKTFLNNKKDNNKTAIETAMKEIFSLDLLDIIPVHRVAERASLTAKIVSLNSENDQIVQEIKTLEEIENGLIKEVMV